MSLPSQILLVKHPTLGTSWNLGGGTVLPQRHNHLALRGGCYITLILGSAERPQPSGPDMGARIRAGKGREEKGREGKGEQVT
ncbi:hypothetical protein E2C01_061611 [Portunus trituberculatus]|uniref:Uncharacterized protein n=1 Tax=Portunus trituberculatus TaxID=210409 RepID=A0A5B7HBQ7_PORTR|nr:hypothetical protein [Portunus trituberculatus]